METSSRALVTTAALAVAALAALIAALAALIAAIASSGSPWQGTPTPHLPPSSYSSQLLPPAGSLSSGPANQPAPATEELGVNIGLLFSLRTYGPARIDAQLSALARTGATLVRSDAPWEATEPLPPEGGVAQYNWRFEDGIVGALAMNRLRWLPTIDYSPPWARSVRGVDHSAPVSFPDYAAYAGALAARYGVGGSFWHSHPGLHPEPVTTYEIWNEPDDTFFWKPAPDPAAYAQLYTRARTAILSVQPGARVIVGGLTRPQAFLTAMLAAEPALRGHIDGVAIHPYGRVPKAVLGRVAQDRVILSSLGMGRVPLYVTEFGWRTQPPGSFGFAPASVRPKFILQTITGLRASDCGVAAVLLYAWFTPGSQGSFGIDPSPPGSSPAVSAFKQALSAGALAPPGARLC